jgi:hypothetical protein
MNAILYHNFFNISVTPTGLNPMETNKPLGSFGNNANCIKKLQYIMMCTQQNHACSPSKVMISHVSWC